MYLFKSHLNTRVLLKFPDLKYPNFWSHNKTSNIWHIYNWHLPTNGIPAKAKLQAEVRKSYWEKPKALSSKKCRGWSGLCKIKEFCDWVERQACNLAHSGLASMVTVEMSVEAEPKKRRAVMRRQEERQQEEDNNKGREEGLRYDWCKMDL